MCTITIILLLFCFSASCTGQRKTTFDIESNYTNNNIDLATGFENIQTVRLSEIADSVTFVPFETTPQSLMGEGQRSIRFSIPYIFYFEKYFDWTGKYGGSIIKKGQGPYEEVDGGSLLYKDNHFYSKGSKFIEYDMSGKPTGKVRNLYAAREVGTNDFLRQGTAFSVVGEYFIVYDYPATIYFIDRNFETVSSIEVFKTDSSNIMSISERQPVTFYQDKVLFYNFINDTIFHVTDSGLEPRWIVDFNHPLRLPAQIMLEYWRLAADLRVVLRNSNYIENTELIKSIDHKHVVRAAFETESHVFFLMKELIPFAEPRAKEDTEPYIIYFDKFNGKTTRVKGKGFVDDILGMDFFYPVLGIFDEKMINYIWPHELFAYIDECKEKGRDVNAQLLALSKKVDIEDNPILILVHLKK